jgi:Tfp pilus assembly PilM family ATPase/Tfp pilus assembly protein PilN
MQSIGVVFKQDEMVLVALKQGLADYQLEGYRILPFLDLKDEERDQAIVHNIERFVQAYAGGKDNIFIALPRDMALVQFLQIPAAAEENLGATLGFEIDRYTPFGFDDVYFDWHVLNRLPDSGLITVMLITIKRTIVDYYLGLFAKLDIRPQGIEITTTALCNAFAKHQSALDRLQELSWLQESGILNSRMLGVVGKVAPKAVRFIEGVQARKPETENVDVLVEFLDAARCEIAVLVRNCLGLSQVVPLSASTEAGQLQEIQEAGHKALIYLPALGQERNLPLRFCLSGREMQPDFLDTAPESLADSFFVQRTLPVQHKKFVHDTIAGALPVLAMPAGVAVKGLRNTPFDINLIPAARRPKRKKSKRKLVVAAALLALVVALSTYTAARNMKMKERLSVLTEEVNGLRRQVQTIEELQQESQHREKFAAAMKTIRGNDMSKLRILEELTRLIPDDSWLNEFSYKADEKKIRISGFAVSAAKLIPILEESSLFDAVKFSTVITTDKRSEKERFRIEMNLSGNTAKQ